MSDDNTDTAETKDLARRAAIARILRRRHRRVKPRANPGGTEKSWGEYSKVTLTPSNDQSFGQYLGFAILIVLGIGFPILLLSATVPGPMAEAMFEWTETPTWAMVVYYLTGLILFVAGICVIIVVATSLWRIIASNIRRE